MLCKACANAATNAVNSRDISVFFGIDTTGDTVGVSGLSAAVIAAEFRSASPVDVATSAKNIKSLSAKLPAAIPNTCLDVPFPPSKCRGVGIKGAELEAIVQTAHHAEHNRSETSTTNITIYTDSQVAYSECRHASKSTSDRVHKIYGIASRLHTNHHTQLRVAWVPAHSGIRGNEWAHNEARAALSKPSEPIVPTIYSGPHFDFSQPDDSQPDFTERAALAKLERKKILRNLRTAASLFNRHNRMIPSMPAGVSRKAQTLVRRTATNTLMLPALLNRIFQEDPQQGYCTACNTLATTQHVIWECPEHAAARFKALADIPVADQPNTSEDWVIPQDKPPPTVRLLWNQLCSFFYADGGPARLLPRWPSVTANSLQ
ncbi:hypothetical protein HPB47_020528 [Ixodes persulcatus]|uniref:Uncharacterized protein n=1 Tax=Ixodes persulcatus TaxID=34615 RepID=A0AC60QG49_IXOPE|nr:hypothetical protein HPB47_020528 [Ixodes persulcatus]